MWQERVSRGRALALAAGAAAGVDVVRAAAAGAASATQTVFMIRHGEKPGTGQPYGIDGNGNQDHKSLTPQGWQRAGALVELFAPAVGGFRPGLARPAALFAASPGLTGSKRPLQTITPTAQRLGLTVNATVTPLDVTTIGKLLASTPGVSLAAWQHTQLAGIAGALGTVNQPVPTDWPEKRYDVIWIFTRQSDGSWNFAQQTQQLLAGDHAHKVIT